MNHSSKYRGLWWILAWLLSSPTLIILANMSEKFSTLSNGFAVQSTEDIPNALVVISLLSFPLFLTGFLLSDAISDWYTHSPSKRLSLLLLIGLCAFVSVALYSLSQI